MLDAKIILKFGIAYFFKDVSSIGWAKVRVKTKP